MKKYLLTAIFLNTVINSSFAQECEIVISGSVPAHLALKDIVVSTYNKKFPVNARNFSICADKKDLNVVGRHNPANTVYLIKGDQALSPAIYTTSAFIQNKNINLSASSTLAKYACNRRCGYYTNNRILTSPKLQKLVNEYEKMELPNRKKSVDFFKLRHDELIGLYQENTARTLQIPTNSDMWVDPYSGALRYLKNEQNTKSGYFENYISPRLRELFTSNKELKKSLRKNKKLRSLMGRFDSWNDRVSAIEDMKVTLSNMNISGTKKLAEILTNGYKEAEKEFDNYLSNDSKKPFKELTNNNNDFAIVMADWTIAAYTSTEDKDKFSTLFTEHFKRNVQNEYNDDIDKALSRLIDLPSHLGDMSLADGYKHVQVEFSNLLPPSKERYEFRDDLHSVSFVFEKGAWRLDSVSQVPL